MSKPKPTEENEKALQKALDEIRRRLLPYVASAGHTKVAFEVDMEAGRCVFVRKTLDVEKIKIET